MVNVVESFTRLYKRAPTQKEIEAMMRLKEEQEARKEIAAKTAPKDKTRTRIPAERKTPNITKRVVTINKLMLYGLNQEQIADALGLTRPQVTIEVNTHQLPKEDLL
jgi:DNA-binding NarL/FixJ family response regulator